MMHGREKSDPAIVAVKPANKVAPHCGAVRGGVSRSEVGGAKGVDQGECGLAKHALDSAPGSRVTGARTHRAIPCRLDPRWGAVCGKAARTALCGGREVTRVPTASGPLDVRSRSCHREANSPRAYVVRSTSGCMSLPLKRQLTLDAIARVTWIGRAEPQARRVSHERS